MKKLMIAVSALACASALFAEDKTQWTNLLNQTAATFTNSVWTFDKESGDDMWVENGQIIVDTDISTGAVFTPESVPENLLQSAIHSKVTFDAFIKDLPERGVNQAGLTIVSNDTVDCEFRFLTGEGWVAGNEECPAAELNKEYDLAIAVNYASGTVDYYLGDGDGNYTIICRGTKGGDGTTFNELAVMGTGKFSLIKAGVESLVPPANITLPELPIEGVESLVVSQSVDGVEWTLVEDNKIDDGNQYVVVAIPSDGYRANNPIKADTAAAGEEIVITEEQVKANVAKIAYVAQIGSTKYESLKEAVEAALGGDTIEVIANCEVPETICFYNTGTNAENQITLKNDYHVELTTFGPGGKNPNNYSIYIVNANVKVTGNGDFSKTNGSASAFVVGSMKDAGKSGRPETLGCGVLDFEGKLTGGVEGLSEVGYSAAPSGMIKVEAGFCNFIGGSVVNWRNDGSNGKCVSATSMEYKDESGNVTNKFVGVVTIQAGTFKANEPLLAENDGELHIIGKDNTAKVRPLDDEKELDYSAYCEPGYTFLKVTDDQDPDYQWYKVGMNTFSIVVLGEGCYGTANPNEFTVETEFPLTVALTKPETPEGKKFDSWSANHGEIDGETLTIDAFPNENVIVTVVWKDIHYVAQIVVDEATTNKYETLKEAFDAANAGDTVTLIADTCETARTVIEKKITFDLNGKTLTYTGSYGLQFKADGSTVKNGTVTMDISDTGAWYSAICFSKAGGLVKDVIVNAGDAKYGVVAEDDDDDVWDATVVCENVKVNGSGVCFYAETEKMTLDENCVATQSGTSPFGDSFCDAVASGWNGVLTINGGTYTGVNAVGTMSSVSTININGGTFTGEFNVLNVECTISITGGTFTADPTAYVADGYKAKKNEQNLYEVVQIQYATVTIDTVANCTIAVTNGETEVTTGATFDQDDATVLKVYRTPAEGYVLDNCAAYEEITLVSDTNITAAVKSAGPAPIPHDNKIEYRGITAANADEAIGKVEIKSPDTTVVDDATYAGYFNMSAEATDVGVFTVTATLKPEITKAEAETAELADQLDDLINTDSTMIVLENAKPGLWYSLNQGQTIAGREEGTRVQATSEGVNLIGTHFDGAGFYQIMVNTAAILKD